MFLDSTGDDATPGSHRAPPLPRVLRGIPLPIIASSLLIVGCGSGEGSVPGPRVVGEAIAVEGAHEHGAARMGFAVDDTELTLDLQAPGDAIFGFEHPPATDEERAVVTEALDRVRTQAGSLVALDPSLGCAMTGVEIVEAPDIGEGHDADDHHAEDEAHDHDEDHSHDDSHDEEAHDDEEHQHSEMQARVTWSCTASPEGSPATLRLASLLPDVEFVDLTVITSRGQAAARVAPDAAFSF